MFWIGMLIFAFGAAVMVVVLLVVGRHKPRLVLPLGVAISVVIVMIATPFLGVGAGPVLSDPIWPKVLKKKCTWDVP